MASSIVSCSQFTQFLTDQAPHYDEYVIKDIRPADGWIAHVTSGTFEAWSTTSHTRDRFNAVYPNTTKIWREVSSAGCLGTPCDKNENLIGWGSTRIVYFLEEQSWATQLLCYDQEMHITKAKEQWSYIISDVLKPATIWIQSNFLRKRGAQYCDNKYIANRFFGTTASNFLFQFSTVTSTSDEEIYMDCNCAPTNVFKLTPQMLQRLVEPLLRIGYLGKNPFRDAQPPKLQLVTDMQTLWELDRLGGQTGVGNSPNPSVFGNWRFEDFEASSKYWMYGFSGQSGNFTAREDSFGLRFNFVGTTSNTTLPYRYQIVQPYKNVATSGAGSQAGLKSINNSDFDNAQYAFSYIWHPRIINVLVADAQPVNPEMPFAARNFGGKWQFVMDNLGADVNGCVIENKRRNKGQFIADFKEAIAPDYTEFGVLIFHKREPACVTEIQTCNADPGYPTQVYNSANTTCVDEHSGTSPTPINTTLTFTPTKFTPTGTYEIAANSILCEGAPTTHGAISGASTLSALVVLLNFYAGYLGTWTVLNATQIQLVGPCATVTLPFETTS